MSIAEDAGVTMGTNSHMFWTCVELGDIFGQKYLLFLKCWAQLSILTPSVANQAVTISLRWLEDVKHTTAGSTRKIDRR